ncbi:follistatin-related protein 1-like isoform X1 [Patiria miniata]|uniref:Follistatin-related protein 1 n=1 Tax=Patiria miniata TaxID=46514 RepID=A0A914ANK7_PATMI|nr:follistatin-related protein 1-like isoform X1 [Patiria miniata]
MALKLTSLLIITLVLTSCEVLTKTGKANRGRHIKKEWRGERKATEADSKSLPSQADVCAGVECGVGKECTLTTDGEASCVCVQECRRHRSRLLCASDGVTYTNECELQRAACRGGIQLFIEHEGVCAPLPTDPTPTSSPASRTHPIACYQDQRDTLQREIVEWLQGVRASAGPGDNAYEALLEDYFARFDDTQDNFLEPTEFLKFVEHNETLQKTTDDLNQYYEEDTLLRSLCVDALLAEADENFDWRLSLSEFKKVMMPGFNPPTKLCSLEGKYFMDGQEKKNKCNICICACGNWVCTANACDGRFIAGERAMGENTEETVSKDTWLNIMKKLSSVDPVKFPTDSHNVSQLAAKVIGREETVIETSTEEAR